MTNTNIIGWDIGGAHLKVAQCTTTGKLIDVFELPCPLWRGIEHLEQALQAAQLRLETNAATHAITMTGELVDLFPNRETGVKAIIDCFTQVTSNKTCHVYAGQHGWHTPEKAKQHWQQVASQNWQASASFTASKVESGLFVDVGSTTSDIITINNHQSMPNAFDDFNRQAQHELYYAGALRTPLIAIASQAPFQGMTIPLAAEFFATTGDCWVLLDQLDPNTIQDSSADGQPWDKQYCASRIARLLGTDREAFSMPAWLELAEWFTQQQTSHLKQACNHVINGHPNLPKSAPLIGAGIGRFMVKQCAKELDRPYLDFSQLITPPSPSAGDHAPSVAVALLASQQLT